MTAHPGSTPQVAPAPVAAASAPSPSAAPESPARLGERIRQAADLLEAIVQDPTLLAHVTADERARLMQAAGKVFAPDRQERRAYVRAKRQRVRAEQVARDEKVLQETGIRQLRRQRVFTTPNVFPPAGFKQIEVADDVDFREVVEPRNCYICKRDFSRIHEFYDQLCPECAELNYRKRTEVADLRGRVALITGSRVKIGYQAAIKLLRCGAHVIATTRFPRDAAVRFAGEADFSAWSDRLEIFGLDLRHTPSVEAFCRHILTTRARLDFIVNNACQTVRRPPDFYRHMMEREQGSLQNLPPAARQLLGAYEGLRGYALLPEGASPAATSSGSIAAAGGALAGLTHPAALSQAALLDEEKAAQQALFPIGRLDQDLQQIDLRERNSWRMLLAEVSTVELLEVQLVNAIAPFVLNGRLKPLMTRTPERDKHIVNVSAVEGQFYRKFKTSRHPHTNMAKAALNMMTRTSATEYHADGIHMNAVDTGWVTDEDPAHIADRKNREHRFHPPLDIVDGAARIVDPILSGFNTATHVWGQFLKDYKPADW